MGHGVFWLLMGLQEPVFELPGIYLFNRPPLWPQKLVAPGDVTEGIYEVLNKRSASQDCFVTFASLDLL